MTLREIKLVGSKQAIAQALLEAWEAVATTLGEDTPFCDPGMVEGFVESHKVNGRAFETRVNGTLNKNTDSSGKPLLTINNVFSRVGGSAFFSNISVGYQQGAQKLEGFPGALEPLWWDASGQHTPVPAALAQVEAFQKLLTSSSIPIFEILGRYSLEALAPLYERSALDWSNLEVEFDFFWLPDGKGGFVPHLNEGLLLPANLTEDLEEYP